jgi:uncharacterized protein YqeY
MTSPHDIRSRLRRALTGALKARDAAAASALRTALGAIGNAEAVAPGPVQAPGTGSIHVAGAVAGLGAAEAPRRTLTEGEVAGIVRAEITEREAAAARYERGGRAAEAAQLRHGSRRLMALLDGEDDPVALC